MFRVWEFREQGPIARIARTARVQLALSRTSCKLYWPKATRPCMRRSRRHGRWMQRPPSEFCRPVSACTPIPDSRGKGITIALVDAGFYPHPDLVQPRNRIRVWADATDDPVSVFHFEPEESPSWPDWDSARDWQWHGTMTSTVAAGRCSGCLLRSASMFANCAVLLFLCPLLFRECPEWIVPCGRHGALWCLLPRPHHCSCLVSPAVLVPQPDCISRGPVDQYTGRGGVLYRRGDSHCGRSHERVWSQAPITSPHDLMLQKLSSHMLGGVRRTQSLQGNTPRSGLGGSVNIAMNSSKLLSGSRK